MTRSKVETLYTQDVLTLATSLAAYPLTDAILTQADARRGEARSASCGSSLEIGLIVSEGGAAGICRIGIRANACAIGQAASALFVQSAIGRNLPDLIAVESAITVWLAGGEQLPDWPELSRIAGAKAYPARHGAILLPWRAAIAALSSSDKPV